MYLEYVWVATGTFCIFLGIPDKVSFTFLIFEQKNERKGRQKSHCANDW